LRINPIVRPAEWKRQDRVIGRERRHGRAECLFRAAVRMRVNVHRFILHNSEIREASDLVLSPGQVGLLSGWGVFSTMKVINGVIFAYERHLARMQRDAALMRVPFPSDLAALEAGLLRLLEANGAHNATLRVIVVRNEGGMWQGPSTGRLFDVVALTADLKHWDSGVKLKYVEQARHSRSPFAGTKILSWSMNLAWLEEAQCAGFHEVILLNEHGAVSECTSANIFATRGGQVLTPPLSSGCLPGITRELLLEEIHVPGIRIVEQDLYPADLETADEVFITSTTRNLLPVHEIEGKPAGRDDRARTALQAAFDAHVDRYLAARKTVAAR
jgi:branched-chain amino acid aminotransferase